MPVQLELLLGSGELPLRLEPPVPSKWLKPRLWGVWAFYRDSISGKQQIAVDRAICAPTAKAASAKLKGALEREMGKEIFGWRPMIIEDFGLLETERPEW